MVYADIYNIVKGNNNKLTGTRLIGKITDEVPQIENTFSTTDENGTYVEVDILYFHQHNSDISKFGLRSSNNIFLSDTKVITYINKTTPRDTLIDIRGTLYITKAGKLVMFSMTQKDNQWKLHNTYCVTVDTSIFDEEQLKYYELSSNNIVRPKDIKKEVTIQPLAHSYSIIKENRTKVKPYLSFMNHLTKELKNAELKRYEFIRGIHSTYYIDSVTDTLRAKYMLSNIINNIGTRPKYLDSSSFLDSYILHTLSCKPNLLAGLKEVILLKRDTILNLLETEISIEQHIEEEILFLLFRDKYKFYAVMFSIIFNINTEELYNAYIICNENELSIIRIINENPYLLVFLTNLSIKQIEKIANIVGVQNDTSLTEYRQLALLHSSILASNSTVFGYNTVNSSFLINPLTANADKKISNSEPILSKTNIEHTKRYVKELNSTDTLLYKTNPYKNLIGNDELYSLVKKYIERGLGVSISDMYFAHTGVLEKEIFIYKKLYELASYVRPYTSEKINTLIERYESGIGFTLEARQRDGVFLLRNGACIISGGAGSGKTTTASCLLYVLRQLESTSIEFAAPTGKASKRLQEVVKEPVNTIHKLLNLSIDSSNTLFTKQKHTTNTATSSKTYIIDESSMINIDLMYDLVSHLNREDRIIFLGDCDQLPPIGKGLPFKSILSFLPCVFLEVTKRAMEGSNITRNSHIINTGNGELISGNDFIFIDTNDTDIQSRVKNIVGYYLGLNTDVSAYNLPAMKFKPDDIQVVTPVTKERYAWGSTELNKTLKPLFNRGSTRSITFNDETYTVGDRIIHTNTNMYSMCWYKKSGNFYAYQKTGGVFNGDVGKIIDLVDARDITILGKPDRKSDRKDILWTDSFLIAEYIDNLTNTPYYILYRYTKLYNNTIISEDLPNINLFYAGTVHKMQGSQNKLIVCCVGNVYGNFINKQMLYTMITRGEKLVILIGNKNTIRSAVNKSATKEVLTLEDVIR